MKKLYVLVIIFLVLLTGCKGTAGKTSGIPSEAKSSDQAVSANTDESTQVVLDYTYSRKPSVANWSSMGKKLTSIESSNMRGSTLDLRLSDLSSLDLTDEFDRMKNIVFDSKTIWTDKLPEGFDPVSAMETGKNPGLGIRSLQEKGITGKGVNIAIIDQPLLLEHIEYGNQIKLYDEINASGEGSMHGPFVASLSVGKSCGVAPEAGLFFIGCYNMDFSAKELTIDNTYFAEAVDRVIEVNKGLPADQKIRALSISASWCPENVGYQELTEAVERAKAEGIFVISCNLFETYGFWTYCLDKEPLADPDNPESYAIFEWDQYMKMVSHIPGFVTYYEDSFNHNFNDEMLLIPTGTRTYAEPVGNDIYCMSRIGGWSAMEPYLAGLYALAYQVKPDITPELFWETALKTGTIKEIAKGDQKYQARMLNPVKLIEDLQNQ